MPYGIADHSETEVRVEFAGISSNSVRLAVGRSAPAIFTTDASGRGQAAILNRNYSVNGSSFPAEKGSVVTVYDPTGYPFEEDSVYNTFPKLAARQVFLA